MIEYGPIDGVELHRPAVFLDERGQVRRYMRSDDEWFSGFAEVYFSMVNPGVVKAWHLHKEMTLCYGCIHGDIMLGLHDGREDSPTYQNTNVIRLSGGNPLDWMIVKIPPGVWNGFRNIPKRRHHHSIIVNCTDVAHRPDEIVRAGLDEICPDFPWGEYERAG